MENSLLLGGAPKTILSFSDLLEGLTRIQKSCYTHDYGLSEKIQTVQNQQM